MRLVLLTALLLGGLLGIAAPRAAGKRPPKPRPVPIIFDTDIGPDVDDAGAAAILNALADLGEAKILVMVCCTSSEWGPPCLDAINTYYGRPDVPIGTFQGKGFLTGSRYNEQVARQFPNDLRSAKNAEEATALYRRLLKGQRNHSVVICVTGPLNNLAALLRSPGEAGNKLTGADLVKKKVRLLVVMGGAFPRGVEFNFRSDAAATARVCLDWPTPILFSGFEIGSRIMTGARLAAETPESNPVRAAFRFYNGGKNRQSWDETAILAAVRGPNSHWKTSPSGSTLANSKTGENHWSPMPERGHFYLIERDPPADVARAIEDLMVRPPKLASRPGKQ